VTKGTDQAAALLAGQDLLIAPDLIVAEVANAGWKAVRAGTMLPEQHDHAAARLWPSTA
jgi:predicted nucleic acid-binding protein